MQRHIELIGAAWGLGGADPGCAEAPDALIPLVAERLSACGAAVSIGPTLHPPTAERRYGVLVDHLVHGSKEARIADAVLRGRHGAHVKIVGHPYVDVWQCVKPDAVGIAAWPEVPRGVDYKTGVCRALGWPAETQADLARAWQRILGSVRSYRDLEPALLGRVEELIDFVTAPS